ncbi:MAG: hypothetical protein DWB99_06410 [Candidatus Poseidoniales archaeon]|nr:MAG: hypothetical protein DWB99_06410 [Candidatus Poseidoniales archaeon]|tara:strand:- start:2054 stop:2656 length:603 start_codon:yes stop_codon:yes gene_type:complete
MTLSDMRDRLQQLLDGELDASEIADDAALVSLADRLYGIKIAPVKPVKSRDFVEHQPGVPVTEVAPPTNMLIEVIEPVGVPAANLPHLEMPELPSVKKKNSAVLKLTLFSGLLVVIANLFGLLSNLLGSLCDVEEKCRGVEQTRINLLSPHKINSSDGWSFSILSDGSSGLGGTSGAIGIPDVVAIAVLLIGTLMLLRKK